MLKTINVEREYPSLYLVQLLLKVTFSDVYSLEDLNKAYKKRFPENKEVIKLFDEIVADVEGTYPEKTRVLIEKIKEVHNEYGFNLTL